MYVQGSSTRPTMECSISSLAKEEFQGANQISLPLKQDLVFLEEQWDGHSWGHCDIFGRT
jgi:hypothetical protein